MYLHKHSYSLRYRPFNNVKKASDWLLFCSLQITDETEMAKYRRRLRDWERERERQIHEFTITEKDLARSSALRSKGSAPGAKSESVLAINSSSAHKDLYSAPPKSKTYKSYKVGGGCVFVYNLEHDVAKNKHHNNVRSNNQTFLAENHC